MCNEIKCAVQENVQIGCTWDVHKAAVWMMGNNGCDYSLLNWVLWMLWVQSTSVKAITVYCTWGWRSMSCDSWGLASFTVLCVCLSSSTWFREDWIMHWDYRRPSHREPFTWWRETKILHCNLNSQFTVIFWVQYWQGTEPPKLEGERHFPMRRF